MKKIFILFSFMSLISVALNAQICPHSKTSTSTAATEVSDDYAKTVATAAESDATIEKKVCEKSGKVSYTRKNVCETSGKVSYTDVEYNAETKKFVNVSPSDAATKKASCCSASCSKTCCAGKSKSSSASSDAPDGDGKVKMVKSEQ